MSIEILTRRRFLNAIEIQALEQHIEYYRKMKIECDKQGYLQDEYKYHNALKYLLGELVKFVQEQRFIKKLLRSLKKPKVNKKHRLGEKP